MNDFLTWESLTTYVNFVSIVFVVVEFTKKLKFIKKINTKYWSFWVSFFLQIVVRIATYTFNSLDLILYFLTSISISLSSNGLSDFNNKN